MTPERLRTVAMLKRLEGFNGQPYKDSEGFLTIGYGHKLEGGPGIDERTAETQLLLDIQRTEQQVERMLSRSPLYGALYPSLDPVRREALVQMAFQMGIGSNSNRTGLLGFRNMLKAMKVGDFPLAAREALDSKWRRQDPTRAAIVARMIETGEWPTGELAEERQRLGTLDWVA